MSVLNLAIARETLVRPKAIQQCNAATYWRNPLTWLGVMGVVILLPKLLRI
jgi:hypothetical protein